MSIERVNLNPDDSLDEVMVDRAFIHIEQMAPDHWWVGISRGPGLNTVMLHVNFRTKHGAAITAAWEDEGLDAVVLRKP